MKTFKTEDILSCSTGVLAGDIGGVYEVLNYLTASDVYTHQIPQLMKPAGAALRQTIPDLPSPNDAVGVTRENVEEFRMDWILRFGATIDLPEALAGCLTNGDPLADLVAIVVGGDS